MPKGVQPNRDRAGKNNPKFRHGYTAKGADTRLYWVFHDAKRRCGNPAHRRYEDYGGRGIEFRFQSVAELAAELGPRPEGQQRVTLDRICNEGHYEQGNVRWATYKQQANNRRAGSGWWGSHNAISRHRNA